MMKGKTSFFILVSCNFDKAELNKFFSEEFNFSMFSEIQGGPKLTFGGATGSTVSGFVFKLL